MLLETVKGLLAGDLIDFLFIDGPFLRWRLRRLLDVCTAGPPGGHIAFRDIVPDYRTRSGIETDHDVGEVPRFWETIKHRYVNVLDFVEDREQDGYGIGLIEWPGAV